MGLRGIGGQDHLYGHSYPAIGLSLDAGRAAHHPVIVAAVPKGQRESIGELISAMETKVGSYIAGQGLPLPGHWHHVSWLPIC